MSREAANATARAAPGQGAARTTIGAVPPPNTDREAARARWRAAASFRDLCVLTQEFLGGALPAFPGWGAPDLDEETDAIAPGLVALAGRGFLTLASQPGLPERAGARRVVQRAFVTGFVEPPLARRLARARPAPGIAIAVFAPGASGGDAEPVTRIDGEPVVLAGHCARDEELALFEDEVGPAAFAELRAASYVAIWDREWGRERALWDELLCIVADDES